MWHSMTREYAYKKAEDKMENNEHVKMLEYVIPAYDERHGFRIQMNMMLRCKKILLDAEKFFCRINYGKHSQKHIQTHYPQMRPFTIKGGNGEPAYFTIKIMTPSTQYIPSEFKMLHSKIRFSEYGHMEYVPCYLLDLNHVVLIKMEQNRSDSAHYDRESGDTYQKLLPCKGRLPHVSSTGIFRFGSAKDRRQPNAQEIIKKCFELCYWRLPKPESTKFDAYDLIYHKSRMIIDGRLFRMKKTLLKIVNISKNTRTLSIMPHSRLIKYHDAKVTILVEHGDAIISENRQIKLVKNIAESLKKDDVINAIIIEQPTIHPKYSIVIGKIGPTIQPLNIFPILGLVLWKNLQHITTHSSITRAGDLKGVSDHAQKILEDTSLYSDVFSPNFMLDKITNTNNIKNAIDKMFPLYVTKSETIHQISPSMLSFISIFNHKLLSERESIKSIIGLLDILDPNSHNWGKKSQDALGGATFYEQCSDRPFSKILLENLPKLTNKIVYSRILSQY